MAMRCVIAVSCHITFPRTQRFFIGLAEEEYEKIRKEGNFRNNFHSPNYIANFLSDYLS